MTTSEGNDLSIELVPLATMTLTMAEPFRIDNTPVGTRVIVEFAKVEWEGERLRASRKGTAAADWLTVGPEGTGCLDFRFLLQAEGGALIFVHGLGRNHATGFFSGATNYFTMSFETGDEKYTWLNRIQAVAKGRLQPDGKTIKFAVHEVR